jgi:hypothetical protein
MPRGRRSLSRLRSVPSATARRRRAARGDQRDLRDLFMCRRGYLGSLVVCAAETFLMELGRAYENLRTIQRQMDLSLSFPRIHDLGS